ncbi:integrase core domain-containing protein [Paraglaciecola chathamensis]|uniref:Integrase catalytic domain-containing protein n=1 Tax=Paraglaciecola agarilytica NO2 TaxID=1125747 RepID=A0ABQ0IAP0_9ALTE|nr:integrase core domain-containing protein [Paraglaciecola agarilytica]GAC06439.1 hypothetical protein GAGA_3606 [Paraglaciecola agarilytica NO2]
MSHILTEGLSRKTFNIIDDYNREGLAINVYLSVPNAMVIRSLKQVIVWQGDPTQNPYVAWFNRTARQELLNLHMFESVEQAQNLATYCLCIYNSFIKSWR